MRTLFLPKFTDRVCGEPAVLYYFYTLYNLYSLKIFFYLFIILTLLSCGNGDTPDIDPSLPSTQPLNLPVPQPITYTIDNVYPHDPGAFTQGLEYHEGKLYEGTGEPKESRLRIVDVKSGSLEQEYLIPDPDVFGEGVTIFKDKIYQLTWQNHKIFVYNKGDIKHPVKTYNWSSEGWGITNDGHNLIISDGSSRLYYVLPDSSSNEMRTQKVLTVADNRGQLDSLNELEYINGYVYANRWYTNEIVKVDTSNGHVVGIMNLTGLLKQYAPNAVVREGAVLNGIAYDSAANKVFITGKYWPKLFEITMNN